MRSYARRLAFILLTGVWHVGACQNFPNTLEFDSATMSFAPADLSVLSWLPGHWRGEMFGGAVEEVWTPALGGSMMGAFKSVVNGKVVFYELVTIQEKNKSLVKMLRHFNPNMQGWEDKTRKPVTAVLIKVEPGRVYFDGFTYEKVDENEINIYAIFQQRDGTKQEVRFNFKRFESP